jgi:predicted DNA-binding transcriptional regulator AlpA
MTAKTYTTREAAKALGVSHQTLYTWIEGGHIDAPEQLKVGKSTIRLWTAAEIERARQFKGTLKPGPHIGATERNLC